LADPVLADGPHRAGVPHPARYGGGPAVMARTAIITTPFRINIL
jgi:hypothetical protein